MGFATNNQTGYDTMIDLLVDALAHRILHLHVFLDSLILVMQLNGVYHVHNQVLFRKHLRVKLLVREFETIMFRHVPRAQTNHVYAIVNNILYWHISHVYHRR